MKTCVDQGIFTTTPPYDDLSTVYSLPSWKELQSSSIVQACFSTTTADQQAFLDCHEDRTTINDLPELNANTMQQIALKASQSGKMTNLLQIIVRTLHIIGNVGLGFVVTSTFAGLLAAASLPLSIPLSLAIGFLAADMFTKLLLIGVTCKVSAHALQQLTESKNLSPYDEAIENHEDFKAWAKLKEKLPQMKTHLKSVREQIIKAKTVYDIQQKNKIYECENRIHQLDNLLHKIDTYEIFEKMTTPPMNPSHY